MPERCEECGFDSDRWRPRDAATLFDALAFWWREATAGIPDEVLNRRPAPAVWSVGEYALHSALVTAWHRELMLGTELPPIDLPADATTDDVPLTLEIASLIRDLQREGHGVAAVARDAEPEPLFHAVHDATHHLMDVGRGLVSLNAGTPRQRGTVVQVNSSNGGVPKLPTDGGHINYDGLAGDRQGNRKHHGRPFQALCLWSSEVIDELRDLGHAISAGSTGENITLSGIDWATLRPGTPMRIGTAVAELSFPTVPCRKQTRWFSDGDFKRIAYEVNPQWVRWYAWVREPGEVRPGDPVVIAA